MTDRGRGFDRIRSRVDDAQPSLQRPDPQGRQSLFSDAGEARAMGPVTITCSDCGETSAVTLRQALRLALPSLHLPLLRPGYSSLMRCPACRRRTWVKLGVQI
jgi:hypothetical protein